MLKSFRSNILHSKFDTRNFLGPWTAFVPPSQLRLNQKLKIMNLALAMNRNQRAFFSLSATDWGRGPGRGGALLTIPARPFDSPGGTFENGPAFQRREKDPKISSPAGTADSGNPETRNLQAKPGLTGVNRG
jgi:hypothetical protein